MTSDAMTDEAPNPDLAVKMRHPDSGPVTITTEEAFTVVWEPKGWERVTDSQAVALDVTDGQVEDLSSLKKAQLLEVAASRNVDVDSTATVAQIIEAIEIAST